MAIKNRIESYKLGSDISINEDHYLELAIAQTLSMLNSGEDKGISLGSIFYLQLANYLSEKNAYTKILCFNSVHVFISFKFCLCRKPYH